MENASASEDIPDEASWTWWAVVPVVLGSGLLVGASTLILATRLGTRAASEALTPYATFVVLATAGLAVVGGLGLIVTGLALSRLSRERRYLALTQQGLIEEVSQEFDKLRASIGTLNERLHGRDAAPAPVLRPRDVTEAPALALNVLSAGDARARGR